MQCESEGRGGSGGVGCEFLVSLMGNVVVVFLFFFSGPRRSEASVFGTCITKFVYFPLSQLRARTVVKSYLDSGGVKQNQ